MEPCYSKSSLEDEELFVNEKASANINAESEFIVDNERNIKYRKGKYLGKGTFAKCFEVEEPTTGKILACKTVNKKLLNSNRQIMLNREINIHQEVNHKHIVNFHSNFQDEENIYILLELCNEKSLKELVKRRKFLTEPEARYFLRQITMAIVYLHEEKRVIHRDVKPGNMFLNDIMQLKLGDFGFAIHLEDLKERPKDRCGTPNFIAPEMLDKQGHGFEADIWSLGCTLYTMLVGTPPFETDSWGPTFSRIRRADYSFPPYARRRIGSDAVELITQMLQIDPSCRPTASSVMTHDFLTRGYIPPTLTVFHLYAQQNFEIIEKRLTMDKNSKEAKAERLPQLNYKGSDSKQSGLENEHPDCIIGSDQSSDYPPSVSTLFI